MALTPKEIGDALERALGYRVEMKPNGFELRTNDDRRARLQRGSGIACRGGIWALVRLPDGAPIIAQLTTRRRLVQAALEFMAGPRPPTLTDYTIPRAKRVIVPRTGEVRFVWYRRMKRRKSKVVLVPFGAAHR